MELIINAETYHCPDVGDIANLKLYGPIDQQSVQVFESTVLDLYRKGICRIVLDLTDTKYLNSTGLGLLINIAHKVNVVGGGIRLINVAEKFKVLFDMLGLETCLPILAGYEEAIESFGGKVEDLVALDGAAAEAAESAEAKEEQPADEEPQTQEETEEEAQNFTFEGLVIETQFPEEEEEKGEEEEIEEVKLTEEKEEYEAQERYPEAQEKYTEGREEYEERETASPLREVEEEISPSEQEPEIKEEKYEADEEAEKEGEGGEQLPQPGFTFEGFLLDAVGTEGQQTEEAKEEGKIEEVKEEPEAEAPQAKAQEVPVEPDKILKAAEVKVPTVESKPDTGSRLIAAPEEIGRKDVTERRRSRLRPPEEAVRKDVTERRQPQVKQAPEVPVQPLEWYTLKRKTSVRYYDQMNCHKTYPMSVIMAGIEVKYKSSQEDLALQNSMLIVIPRFPGCQVKPERVAVDISSQKAVAEFWITPFTKGSPQGNIPAWIEIWYERKIKELFPTPFKMVNSVVTVIGIICTFVFSLGGVIMDNVQPNVNFFPSLAALLQVIGWRPLGVLCGAIFLVLTVASFLKFHDREASSMEKTSSLKMH